MSEGTKLAGSESAQAAGPRFYVVSINKLIWLSLLSTGVYLFYWLYRNWATYRDATGDRVIPLLRSIIPVLFIYPLVNRVDQHLKHSGGQCDWSPKPLALSMWLITAVIFGAGFLFPEVENAKQAADLYLYNLILNLLQLVGFVWVICKIQQAINVLECDPDGKSNSIFTGANVVWMALGSCIWGIYFFTVAMLLSLAN
jgi:hypothetical protein